MQPEKTYAFLETRPGSLYRQPFIKGTRIRAEILFGHTVPKKDEEGDEPGLSPEQIAAEFDVPLEAVREAIEWCQANWDVVIADHAREERLLAASGMSHPDYKWKPEQHYRAVSPQHRAWIIEDEDLPFHSRTPDHGHNNWNPWSQLGIGLVLMVLVVLCMACAGWLLMRMTSFQL